jgi:hypothetical protein
MNLYKIVILEVPDKMRSIRVNKDNSNPIRTGRMFKKKLSTTNINPC